MSDKLYGDTSDRRKTVWVQMSHSFGPFQFYTGEKINWNEPNECDICHALFVFETLKVKAD